MEVPPPGLGFNTVTELVPRDCRSILEIAIVSCEDETKVVARAEPFHFTTELETKFEPKSDSVNPGDPTAVEFGFNEESIGTGLGVTLIVTAFEVEGPGFVTVIESVPTEARSAAGIVADRKLEFQPFTVMFVPFTCTVEKEMKPEP